MQESFVFRLEDRDSVASDLIDLFLGQPTGTAAHIAVRVLRLRLVTEEAPQASPARPAPAVAVSAGHSSASRSYQGIALLLVTALASEALVEGGSASGTLHSHGRQASTSGRSVSSEAGSVPAAPFEGDSAAPGLGI